MEIFSRLNRVGIEMYSIDQETQNLRAELFNLQFKRVARLFRTQDFKYVLVMTREREKNLQMVQSVLKGLVEEVVQRRPGGLGSQQKNPSLREKGGRQKPSMRSFEVDSGDEELSRLDRSDSISDISTNVQTKKQNIQKSINTLVQNIYKKKMQKESQHGQSKPEDSLGTLMIPKESGSKRELSRGSDFSGHTKSQNEYFLKNHLDTKPSSNEGSRPGLTGDSPDSAEDSSDSDGNVVRKTALKNIKVKKMGSGVKTKPFQSNKTLNVNKHKKNSKKKNKKNVKKKNVKTKKEKKKVEEYTPLFVENLTRLHNLYGRQSSMQLAPQRGYQTTKNFFEGSSRNSSGMRDSDTQSFESHNTEEERALFEQVEFELKQYEQKKDVIREEFKKNFSKIFNGQQVDDSAELESGPSGQDFPAQEPNRLGYLAPNFGGSGRGVTLETSEVNQTIKISKEGRGAYGLASGENSQNNTQSTYKLSGMTSSSYSLQQIDKIYNKLMNEANNIPSANVSWKNSSLKTDLNSGHNKEQSNMSSIRAIQTNNKEK